MIKRKRLPEWIKIDHRQNREVMDLKKQLKEKGLHTVCEEARCPNLAECFGKKKTATFMILGDKCTRNCRFCNIDNGVPLALDPLENENIVKMIRELSLSHAVITSVTRDDLKDGGAGQYASLIRKIRSETNATTEVLTPDFQGSEEARKKVSAAKPDIFNHNIETVKELYSEVRQGAGYKRSLDFLKGIKEDDPKILTKSGIMAGLGETEDQLSRLLDDLAESGIDILTCGQYLQPSKQNIEVREYKTEEWFKIFGEKAEKAGIAHVFSSPFTRSSYNAEKIIKMIRRGG